MLRILFFLGNVKKDELPYKLTLELAKYMLEFYNVYIEIAINNLNDRILKLEDNIFINNLNSDNITSASQRLDDLIGRKNFNVVLGYFYKPNIILALTKIINPRDNTVYIGSFHRVDHYERFSSFYRYPLRFISKYVYSFLDGIVVDSFTIKKEIERTFFIEPDKIEVIYNFIDIKEIRKKALDRLDSEEKRIFRKEVILNVSRLIKEKGHEYLIKAFKIVKEKRKNARLVILGEGEERANLEALIKELNLENSVYLLGYKSNPYKYMINSDVYVLTSSYEGFSRSVLEAQALGLPVIAFKSKGSHVEYLNNSALFVKDKDEKALAKAIINLLENDRLMDEYKNKSLQNIKNFSIENGAKRYFKYFETKLKEKKLEKILNDEI
ncbi:MAG: hypothetical protein DSY60_03045 [Persephonella sp.]|nr:MAG: hypothetical protein DSY60_03045 [Persephonella sp.]